jgi:FkbM family methyltransferase
MPEPTLFHRTLRRTLGTTSFEALIAWRHARQEARREFGKTDRRRELYRRWVRPGSLVFDIGANVGNRTVVFAALGAGVVAVEPQPHCARALHWMFLFQPSVRVLAAAAGRDDSPKTITQFSTDVLSSLNPDWIAAARTSGRFGDLAPVREIVVPGVTLDQLIARHGVPAFTKIDVEGYEAEVLAGLSRPCGTVSFEFTPEMPQLAAACLDRLAALGYTRFQFSAGESMQLAAWSDATTVRAALDRLDSAPADFGDIYALAPDLAA